MRNEIALEEPYFKLQVTLKQEISGDEAIRLISYFIIHRESWN
jgi:hypothetical protein